DLLVLLQGRGGVQNARDMNGWPVGHRVSAILSLGLTVHGIAVPAAGTCHRPQSNGLHAEGAASPSREKPPLLWGTGYLVRVVPTAVLVHPAHQSDDAQADADIGDPEAHGDAEEANGGGGPQDQRPPAPR